MNDQQLGQLIESWLEGSDSPPSDIGRSTAEIESRLPLSPQRSRWWPWPAFEGLSAPVAGRTSAGGSSMFSAVKFVVAAAIVALFGVFLLNGALSTPQNDAVPPAAVTDSPTPLTTARPTFPTGVFSADGDDLSLEFHADGKCLRAGIPCTYGVVGRLFTEMTFEDPTGEQVPATYYWAFDDERLTFERYGEDRRPGRRQTYEEHTYRLVETGAPNASSTQSGFPTGGFVASDDSSRTLAFDDDGRWRAGSPSGGASGTYAVNGNLYTEMRHNSASAKVPATYYWRWDGERLSFSRWGEDADRWRQSFYAEHTYVRAAEPAETRRLLLSHPQLDIWVTVEVTQDDDGRFAATATEGDEPLGDGAGDTLQEAIGAALEPLGEPYASEIARSVKS